ncbi:serine O-acetyltransferase [Deinococcus maricopensis]|uniref:Hexapeptide transferase family protein n=1 Tax=Deinococcus maricopensis (strain DSM 21211 / LMG 22137 / NRRL B-23946 / LB-34) TaxID=709986 RepID=E8U3E3_DEIML|nr:serine acetyltransferase [Deinococcus maricopensis]ADV65814.1 hexapeptide transferase family protein [Deinococcus maricopensis DSM 21211]
MTVPQPRTWPELRAYILADLARYEGTVRGEEYTPPPTPAAALRLAARHFWTSPGFKFLVHYRTAKFLRGRGLAYRPLFILARLLHGRYFFKYGMDIPLSCNLGPGVYFGHFGNIIISPDAVVHGQCNIAQGVTIGVTRRGTNVGAPTLHENVWIGANAVVVGNVTLAPGTLVAPLSYVTRSTEPDAVLVGVPAQPMNHHGSAGYVLGKRPARLPEAALSRRPHLADAFEPARHAEAPGHQSALE